MTWYSRDSQSITFLLNSLAIGTSFFEMLLVSDRVYNVCMLEENSFWDTFNHSTNQTVHNKYVRVHSAFRHDKRLKA